MITIKPSYVLVVASLIPGLAYGCENKLTLGMRIYKEEQQVGFNMYWINLTSEKRDCLKNLLSYQSLLLKQKTNGVDNSSRYKNIAQSFLTLVPSLATTAASAYGVYYSYKHVTQEGFDIEKIKFASKMTLASLFGMYAGLYYIKKGLHSTWESIFSKPITYDDIESFRKVIQAAENNHTDVKNLHSTTSA